VITLSPCPYLNIQPVVYSAPRYAYLPTKPHRNPLSLSVRGLSLASLTIHILCTRYRTPCRPPRLAITFTPLYPRRNTTYLQINSTSRIQEPYNQNPLPSYPPTLHPMSPPLDESESPIPAVFRSLLSPNPAYCPPQVDIRPAIAVQHSKHPVPPQRGPPARCSWRFVLG
jgi:hypothetical protein